MTSMSTKIDDLPGPLPPSFNINENNQSKNDIPILNSPGNSSNITMDIKKKNTNTKTNKEFNMLEFLQSQITEENLLLLLILILSSRTELDNYMVQLPVFGQTLLNSNILLSITKAIIILLLYILLKSFLLPKV